MRAEVEPDTQDGYNLSLRPTPKSPRPPTNPDSAGQTRSRRDTITPLNSPHSFQQNFGNLHLGDSPSDANANGTTKTMPLIRRQGSTSSAGGTGHGSDHNGGMISPDGRKGNGTPKRLEKKISEKGMVDDLDEVAYSYALRVAYINKVLQSATHKPPSSTTTPSSNSRPGLGAQTISSPYFVGAKQGAPGLSPAFSMSSNGSTPGVGPGDEKEKEKTKKGFFGRKKSMSGIKDKDRDRESTRSEPPLPISTGTTKFPKDFLPAFWDVLANEGGDTVWRASANTFLSHLAGGGAGKKATKTASGLNLREVGTLLEAFSSAVTMTGSSSTSTPGGGSAGQKHVHLTHFIGLLQNALTNYYNPLSRKTDDKEREVISKLRYELERYSLRPETPSASSSSGMSRASLSGARSPGLSETSSDRRISTSASGTPTGLGSPFLDQQPSTMPQMPPMPSAHGSGSGSLSPRMARNPSRGGSGSSHLAMTPPSLIASNSFNSISSGSEGAMTPGRFAETPGAAGLDLLDTVARCWGVDEGRLRRDVDGMRRAGLNESSYLSDLKLHLQILNSDPSSKTSSTAQLRVGTLQTEISTLLHARPDLAHGAGTRASVSTPSGNEETTTAGQDFYFTPVDRKEEVYTRLVTRMHEMLGCTTTLPQAEYGESELIDLCAGIWGIATRAERETAVLVELWSSALNAQGQEDETVGVRNRMTMTPAGARGNAAELGWAKVLQEALHELEVDAGCGHDQEEEEAVKETVTALHDRLFEGMVMALRTIYPTTSMLPTAPSPSCLPLLTTLYECPQLMYLLGPEVTDECWKTAGDEIRGEAVSEYATKTMELLHGGSLGETEEDQGEMVGYERLADFIESGVRRVARIWRRDLLDGRLDPPGIILAKQLPLFLAELQQFDQPAQGTKADSIFGVYERSARLLSLSEDYCRETPIDFDLDAFFEPHVREWLRATEDVDTHEWVTRSVGMDSWVPEGHHRHSQSVIDLFDFIRRSLGTILNDLPLGEYNRACYLIDFSRTASTCITRYATTVHSLFQAEMAVSGGEVTTPGVESPAAVTGKASAWLAKGKQAMKTLEVAAKGKSIQGFMVPPSACVKLTDMGAAKASVEDLMFAMEADETSRIVRDHKLKTGTGQSQEKPARFIFQITVARGENLLGKGLSKPADAFVSVHDSSAGSVRLHKTNTMIGQIDPVWEETFEYPMSGAKTLEITCYDRNLVGKHELIGTASFKLDPAAFRELPSRDLVLPLNPRGTVYVRLELTGHDKHDVRSHLTRASRALDRAGEDMTRVMIDRMAEYIASQLSMNIINNLLRPMSAKAKKGQAKVVTDPEMKQTLLPLFDYLDANFSTFSVTFSDEVKVHTMTHLWRRVLVILMSLMIPPLSDKEATRDPLKPEEINVVFQWLKSLKSFFQACEGGQDHGVPLPILQSGAYKEIIMLGQYLDLPTPALKEKCVASTKAASRSRASAMPRSNFMATGLTSMGRAEDQEERTAEILLRILRMRPGTADFLQHQIGALNQARTQRQGAVA